MQELNSINRDLTKTASRTRVIKRIKAEHNKRKQEALLERNATLKQMLAQKQAAKRGEAKACRKQKRKKALVLQSDMKEMRMQNIENVLQNVMKEQQKSKTALKNNNSSKTKGRKRKKASDSEDSDSETISSSSEDESEDSSDSEKKSKKKTDKKQQSQKKKNKKNSEKSSKESYNYGSIGNFIKSINK